LYPCHSYGTVVSTVGFRSKPLVVLSILLVLAGAMGGWHAPDDRDDNSAVSQHHHTNHNERFSTASDPIAPEHCAFCHWLRTLGNGAPVSVQVAASQPARLIGRLAVLEHVQAGDSLILPSRAPPLA
jgi:hypothetical protein